MGWFSEAGQHKVVNKETDRGGEGGRELVSKLDVKEVFRMQLGKRKFGSRLRPDIDEEVTGPMRF